MGKFLSNLVLGFFFLLGLSLLLYPTISDLWNSFHQSRAIASYRTEVESITAVESKEIWKQAEEYNEKLKFREFSLQLLDLEMKEYESVLDITDTGIMSYIEIPKIDCSLPIYHGADEAVLQVAIGHLAGTSLPIGGKGSHCVLSGHRGLPSAKLFTDIDKLEKGDVFLLRTLDEVLTYEVDQILVVLPEETEALEIVPKEDLCTLVTCTPYGINSHRLLVRGHRIPTRKELLKEGMKQIYRFIILVSVICFLGILLIFIIIKSRNKKGGDS